MNQFLRALKAPVFAILASVALLAGCGPHTLEFRNAEIINGKVYRAGSDEPFSGHLTNVPEHTMFTTQQGYMSMFRIVADVVQGLHLNDNGPYESCDVDSDDGVLDGHAVCHSGSDQVLTCEATFDDGVLDGSFKRYYPANKEKPFIEAAFDKGKLDGKMKIYGNKTGRKVFQLNWEDGKPDGKEELFDDETGKPYSSAYYRNGLVQGELVRYQLGGDKVVYRAHFVDGLKDGLEETYDYTSGKLQERRGWKRGQPDGDVVRAKLDSNNAPTDELRVDARYDNGTEIPLHAPVAAPVEPAAPAPAASVPSAADIKHCLEVRTLTFQIQSEKDAVITADQLGEWEAACRNGKQPN